jgi:capsular exopolysaccharide synthesis family protein
MSFRVGQATSQYEIVSASAQTRKQLFDVVTKTLNEVTIGADLIANNVSVLDHAIPPLRPIKPQKRLNLALGAMLGMFLGLGMVFFLDYLDNTFRTQEDIERRLNLNTLAVVPRVTGSDTIARGVKEAFQTLRTSLIFLSKNRERKVVLVTSTAPQEGKSSTLAQLARTLAGAGDRVVILDCDLRKPTQHVHMLLERDPGLTNYLAAPRGMDDWRPYLKHAASQNLDVITCGAIPPNPPELLGSERFAKLISRMRETYDWVLLDSPPSISLSDAVLLSAIADMTILVVRHAQTDRDQVARSVLQFRNHNAMMAGVVLNDVDVEKAYRKDYYYAGYYYYDESGKGRRKRASAAGPGEVSSGAGA